MSVPSVQKWPGPNPARLGGRNWRVVAHLLVEASGSWPGWDNRHPLAAHFGATWGRVPEGVRLHSLLQGFPDADARQVVQRLGGPDWSGYSGAALETELAGRMRHRGIAVELIPPSLTDALPDFRAVLVGRAVTFECTGLQAAQRERRADSVFDRLFTYGLAHPGFTASVMVRFVDGALADDAFERIDEIERAIEASLPRVTRSSSWGSAP